jgi:hypothetical protein
VIALWLALAAAAGFAAGHYRLPEWLFDWCYDRATADTEPRTVRRAFAETISALMLLAAFTTHPRRTVRRIRDARRTQGRMPAPQMDPEWGRR